MKIKDYEFIIKKLKLPKKNLLITGSYKRHKNEKERTIGDLDLLAVNKTIDEVITLFKNNFNSVSVKKKGNNYVHMMINSIYSVDVWITTKETLPFAQLQYDTGLGIVHLKRKARTHGLKLSQYGLFKSNKLIDKKFNSPEDIKNYINSL